jgi:hypothetical protein
MAVPILQAQPDVNLQMLGSPQMPAITADGKIYVGGGFGRVKGSTRVGVARLNALGDLDTAWNPTAVQNDATALAVSDTRVFVATPTTASPWRRPCAVACRISSWRLHSQNRNVVGAR